MSEKKLNVKSMVKEAEDKKLAEVISSPKPIMTSKAEWIKETEKELEGEFLTDFVTYRYSSAEIGELNKLVQERQINKQFQLYRGCLFLIPKYEKAPDWADAELATAIPNIGKDGKPELKMYQDLS